MAVEKQVALVTGSGRGIGRGIAIALAERGWSIGVNYRGNVEAASETVNMIEKLGSEALLLQADISHASERNGLVERIPAHFWQINLLVNNAGMAPRQRMDILETTELSYDEVMEVNLKGTFFSDAACRQIDDRLIGKEDHYFSQNYQYRLDERLYEQSQSQRVLSFQSWDGHDDPIIC